jgi:hypothetical protein
LVGLRAKECEGSKMMPTIFTWAIQSVNLNNNFENEGRKRKRD